MISGVTSGKFRDTFSVTIKPLWLIIKSLLTNLRKIKIITRFINGNSQDARKVRDSLRLGLRATSFVEQLHNNQHLSGNWIYLISADSIF
jgi:hypothetical protein